jgi:hypothetical protein
LLAALERMQGDMHGLETRVDDRHADLARLIKEACDRFGPAPAKPFIAKGGHTRFKLHVAAVDGTEVLPTMWKTKCGVKFAGWAFTRHASCEGFPQNTLCTKCFGTSKGASGCAPQAAPSSSSVSEASAGDSSA